MTRSCLKIKDSTPDAPLCCHQNACADIHEVVFTSDQINQTIETLASQIQTAYDNDASVVVPFLLKGAQPFASDLREALSNPKFTFVPVSVSSYHGGTQSTGKLLIECTDMMDITGRPVLILDDIYDSGLTLTRFKSHLEANNPSSIKTCVMFEKECEHKHAVALDFVGLLVPNDFVVGYGLDYQERYRDLHCVGKLKPNVLRSEKYYEDSKSA